ncbi:MAG: iron uptake porin [Microcoleaceae cyanobacterium]
MNWRFLLALGWISGISSPVLTALLAVPSFASAVEPTQQEIIDNVQAIGGVEVTQPSLQKLSNSSELPLPITISQSTFQSISESAEPETWEQLQHYSQEGRSQSSQGSTKSQVTSVSQLADVQPTDWAFQALQSLVERFGCIAGYPDGSFKGNRSLSRYEFAAGVSACLERIQELLDSAVAERLTQDELIALQRLQNEFAAELALLRGRVNRLEERTEALVANQFSTTTKLHGEAIFALTDDLVETQSDANQTVFQSRVRLDLNTSFSGQDLLLTRLQVGNADAANLGVTQEGNQTFNVRGETDTEIELERLFYQFPVSDQFYVTLAARGVTWDDFVPTMNPYLEDYDGGQGTLSSFGQRNPIYRLGGGAGIGLNYAFDDLGIGATSLSVGYLAAGAENAEEGSGLFNGDYSILTQLTVAPTRNLQFAFTYNHAYFAPGNFGFDNGQQNGPIFDRDTGEFDSNALNGFTGTGIANSILGLTEGLGPGGRARSVVSNSYGVQVAWQISSQFVLSAWGGYTAARVIDVGDGDIWNYALNFGFPDLFKEDSLGGIVIGREPYLDEFDSNLDTDFPTDSSWHFEAFYRYQLTDNISITPGLIWITNPNQDSNNDDLLIGTVRSTFRF